VIKENTYFDGGVKSLGFTQQGGDSSVGVMAPGNYTFGTSAAEKMTVVKGALRIKRVDEMTWNRFESGQSFHVIGHSSFEVEVKEMTAYLCEYQ